MVFWALSGDQIDCDWCLGSIQSEVEFTLDLYIVYRIQQYHKHIFSPTDEFDFDVLHDPMHS